MEVGALLCSRVPRMCCFDGDMLAQLALLSHKRACSNVLETCPPHTQPIYTCELPVARPTLPPFPSFTNVRLYPDNLPRPWVLLFLPHQR